MKNIIIIVSFIILLINNSVFYCAQEDIPNKRQKSLQNISTFNDKPIIAHERNFAQEYPELAQGFNLCGYNFQDFMTPFLDGHLAHENIISTNHEPSSILHEAIRSAEEKITGPLLDKFYTTLSGAVYNNKNMNMIRSPHFCYVLSSYFLQNKLIQEIESQASRYHKLITQAIAHNNSNFITFLIQLGVDFSLLDTYSETSLINLALQAKSYEIALTLTQAPGINVNKLNNTPFGKKTVLSQAVSIKNVKLVKALLHHKDINVNIADDFGITPFIQAFIGTNNKEKYAIVYALLHTPAINIYQTDQSNSNALHYTALYSDNSEYIKTLINAGLLVNSRDKFDWTPLHDAIKQNNLDNVRILLESGADKNMRAKKRYSLNSTQTFSCLDLARTDEMRALLTNHTTTENSTI